MYICDQSPYSTARCAAAVPVVSAEHSYQGVENDRGAPESSDTTGTSDPVPNMPVSRYLSIHVSDARNALWASPPRNRGDTPSISAVMSEAALAAVAATVASVAVPWKVKNPCGIAPVPVPVANVPTSRASWASAKNRGS